MSSGGMRCEECKEVKRKKNVIAFNSNRLIFFFPVFTT